MKVDIVKLLKARRCATFFVMLCALEIILTVAWIHRLFAALTAVNVAQRDTSASATNVSANPHVAVSSSLHTAWNPRRRPVYRMWKFVSTLLDGLPFGAGKPPRYVTWNTVGRLGNQLFQMAATLYVSRRTGRRPLLPAWHHAFDDWFRLESLDRGDRIGWDVCPCALVTDLDSLWMSFVPSVAELDGSRADFVVSRSIVLNGHFQSWKYAAAVEDQLRRLLRPTATVYEKVRRFFDEIRPRRWRTNADGSGSAAASDYHRIGIHVRAGDTLSEIMLQRGLTVPQVPYFERAMRRVIDEVYADVTLAGVVRRVQFVVATDSVEWVQEMLHLSSIAARITNVNDSSSSVAPLPPGGSSTVDVELSYSIGHEPGFDMLMLSSCDAVVMTTGTFGWWAAWLSNKTTIYYAGWPRKGSPMHAKFVRQDVFPPRWIGIDGPHMTF
jgi:galactoside 2-L-fucosyltransferase 1/2